MASEKCDKIGDLEALISYRPLETNDEDFS